MEKNQRFCSLNLHMEMQKNAKFKKMFLTLRSLLQFYIRFFITIMYMPS